MERWRRWGIAAGAALLAGYAPVFFYNWEIREGQSLFAQSGRRLLAGEMLYRVEDKDMYAYLPGLSVLMVPLAVLPPLAGAIAWYLVSAGSLAVTLWGAWRLTAGRGVEPRGRWLAVLLVMLFLTGRFAFSTLENQQCDALIAALVMGGLVAWTAGLPIRGALLMGTGAALKGTPLLFVPWLVWRGQWRMALVLTATVGVWTLLPDVVGPRASGWSHVTDCYQWIIAPAQKRPPGMWLTGTPTQNLNQSLGALVRRFAATHETWPPDPGAVRRQRELVWGLCGLLAAVTVLSSGSAGRAWRSGALPDGVWNGDDRRLGVEAGMVCCLMLLFSPQSSKAHFVILALPVMSLARAAVQDRNRVAQGVLVLLGALGPLSVKGLVGSRVGNLFLEWGAPTWFTLLALAGLWEVRLRLSVRRQETPRIEVREEWGRLRAA